MKRIIYVVILLIVVGAGFIGWRIHSHKPSTPNEASSSTSPSPTSVSVKPSLSNTPKPATNAEPQQRADYLYNTYMQTLHANRYDDLKTKGYITENLYAKAHQNLEADLITCSQNPSATYSIKTATSGSTQVALSVTGTYDTGPHTFTESWVKTGDIWQLDTVTCPSS